MKLGTRPATLALALLSAMGCAPDRVHPGFYGEQESTEEGLMAGLTAGDRSRAAAGGDWLPGAGTGPAGTQSEPRDAGADQSTDASHPNQAKPDAAHPDSQDASADDALPCDLSGRWLATLHYVTDALGQQQTAHSWIYYEITQTAEGFEVTRGLHCGDRAEGLGLLPVQVDFGLSRDAVRGKLSYLGQPVRATEASGGCAVHFGKHYTVRGASYPHYSDPDIPLPGIDQAAGPDSPGWEDWDEDGNPGITSIISGTVSGKLFFAPRIWFELSGTVPDLDSSFELPLRWDQETNLLGYDGSPLLTTQGVRAANAALHFAQLARLAAEQATGDDATICADVIALAPTLTPRASEI